ncbi:MAG: MFS transporter [Gammaproteobacteria bacterium]|nr:MFS transporter [Gammaproteobacteria bacterium]
MNTKPEASTSSPISLAGTPAASPLGYFSWTFGQGARDPYYIMVIIYIFFPYFSNTVVGDPIQGQTLIGYLNATGGLILALTAPFLGAIADKNGRRKPWVACTVVLMSVGAGCLWFVLPGEQGLSIYATLGLLLAINTAFAISEVFHNAMLPSIAPVNRVGVISGLAFALGNVGGLCLMLFVLFAFAMPGTNDWSFLPTEALFGIDQAAHEHDRIVGPIAGVWMFLFTLPVLLFTPDGKSSGIPMWQAARQGVRDVLATVRQLKHYANIAIYLLARMFFIDGMVGVMTFGGVYASGTFGWDTTTLLIFGLFTSGSAMIGAYVGGRLDDHLGSIRTLKIAIGMSSVGLITLVSIQPDTILYIIPVSTSPVWEFPYLQTTAEIFYFCTNQVFAMVFVTGLSSSRTLMARLSPPEMATQFFGLFALSGTVTAFLAPLLVATTTDWFQSQRAGFASLAILMIIGGVLLLKVKEEQATVAS